MLIRLFRLNRQLTSKRCMMKKTQCTLSILLTIATLTNNPTPALPQITHLLPRSLQQKIAETNGNKAQREMDKHLGAASSTKEQLMKNLKEIEQGTELKEAQRAQLPFNMSHRQKLMRVTNLVLAKKKSEEKIGLMLAPP